MVANTSGNCASADLARADALQVRRLPVAGQVLPDLLADVARGAGRGHAQQRHAADDEGHHRGVELVRSRPGRRWRRCRRARSARAGWRASAPPTLSRPPPKRADSIGRVVASASRPSTSLAPIDLQVVGLFGLAADRVHLEAGAAEDVDRERADAAGGAGDRQRAEFRRLPVVEHAEQRQRRGEAGGAQDHALAQAQARRATESPIALRAARIRQ